MRLWIRADWDSMNREYTRHGMGHLARDHQNRTFCGVFVPAAGRENPTKTVAGWYAAKERWGPMMFVHVADEVPGFRDLAQEGRKVVIPNNVRFCKNCVRSVQKTLGAGTKEGVRS